MLESQGRTCAKCGFFAHNRICQNRSCVVGAQNLDMLKAEQVENLKVLVMLRVRFGVFQSPTHPSLPHDHQDVEDMTSRGFMESSVATYRSIYAPRSSMNHYLEVVVFAPMRASEDPDRKALLAYQAFNGMDWSSHEVPVLTLIREHQDQEEKLFFLNIDAKTRPGTWNDRDRF